MRQPLPQRLIEEGIAEDEKEAAVLVMSGRVYVNGQRARAGQMLSDKDRLSVRGIGEKYLAKGGYKLEGAIRAFKISVKDRVCIDAGASTGGFTDCLLKHGARLVYAVDVGYGQLLGSLRQSKKVVNLERTNLADPSLLSLSPVPCLGTCDLSYLSLVDAVPLYRAILGNAGELICLVKPLFETADMEARRTGVIDDAAYAPTLRHVIDALGAQPDTRVLALTHSPVTGNTGTREFFLHVRFGAEGDSHPISDLMIEESVKNALSIPEYVKPGIKDAGEGAR